MRHLPRIRRWFPVFALIVGSLLWGGCRSTEVVFSEDVARTDSTGSLNSQSNTYVFQVGDIVTLNLPAAKQSFEERIREDGTISFPLIGSIAVAGKTAGELQDALNEEYTSRGWHSTVPHYRRSDPVYSVEGEVKQDGLRAYVCETTITKAIQAAGGFTESANKKKVKLIRHGRAEFVDLNKVKKDPSLDRRVLPGDRIVVLRRFGF